MTTDFFEKTQRQKPNWTRMNADEHGSRSFKNPNPPLTKGGEGGLLEGARFKAEPIILAPALPRCTVR